MARWRDRFMRQLNILMAMFEPECEFLLNLVLPQNSSESPHLGRPHVRQDSFELALSLHNHDLPRRKVLSRRSPDLPNPIPSRQVSLAQGYQRGTLPRDDGTSDILLRLLGSTAGEQADLAETRTRYPSGLPAWDACTADV
jgi:hypothetical protein